MTGLQDKLKTRFNNTVGSLRTRLMKDITQGVRQRYSLDATDRSQIHLSGLDGYRYQMLEDWLASPQRPHKNREENLELLVKERAYTLVNRLVILFQLEHRGLRSVRLVSKGTAGSEFGQYGEFFSDLLKTEDGGWDFVLQQVWDQLALELPALFSYNELLECVPVPGPSLVWAIDTLADPGLADAWRDDTTLGWLYQYWNDPDRKAVDDKLNTTSGKVEVHELANKTQLFTERYMVEWLVQNSLGAQWIALCKKNRWEPRALGIIGELENQRKAWTKPEEPMVVSSDQEWWKYYVPQDVGKETIEASPKALEDLKLLDPAMGSGHFLVYVFDFLFMVYREQAYHQGREFDPSYAVGCILEKNLHGIDIDNRAVQIAAAALYVKAREYAPEYRIRRLNLVATDLGLAKLEDSDPALVKFYKSLEKETGISEFVSKNIIAGLREADYLGSLLDIHKTIRYISEFFGKQGTTQEDILKNLGEFMRHHDTGNDLGLHNLAEQLSKGLRLIELLNQKYDVVVANPPYLGLAKVDPIVNNVITKAFPKSCTDLYGVFIERGLQLTHKHGFIAMVTMQNFMFLSFFRELREYIINSSSIAKVAHLGAYAFQELRDHALAAMFVIEKERHEFLNVGIYQRYLVPKQKMHYLISQSHLYRFPQQRFLEISGSPMIYWWPEEFRRVYLESKKLGDVGEVRQGLATSMNGRFLRSPMEIDLQKVCVNIDFAQTPDYKNYKWQPFVKGAAGVRWFEGLNDIILWKNNGIEVKTYASYLYKVASRTIKSQDKYFHQGIAFNAIGTNGFLCRLRKYTSIFDTTGSSIFIENPEKYQVLLSNLLVGYLVQSLNPTIHNNGNDVDRLLIIDLIQDHTPYLNRARDLYDRLFASTETNIEYTYQQMRPEEFEVEEARIRDEIDKEILSHFKPQTIEAIYQELGPSPFNYPGWDGTTVPTDFAQAYQESDSVLALSHRFGLHPDGVLALVKHLGLIHHSQRQDAAFQHLSWALGVFLGRFDRVTGGLVEMATSRLAQATAGETTGPGIEAESPQAGNQPRTWSGKPGAGGPDTGTPAGPQGILYLSALDTRDTLVHARQDRLGPGSGSTLVRALEGILQDRWGEDAWGLWQEIDQALVQADGRGSVVEWLRLNAFERHLKLYQNKPIYFPLVSAKKNFFLWVSIHRWTDHTLQAALANYLRPDLQILETRLRSLREEAARTQAARDRNLLETEVAALDKLYSELEDFTNLVTQIAERGPDPKVQEVEAPFVMDLDDGVMVNSAALWQLMQPVWKKPSEWWKALSKPAGKKDFDWSHLAMRYWPKRVMEKVRKDPSLAVAHSDYGAFAGRDLFEELHPEAARKWRGQGGESGGRGSSGGAGGARAVSKPGSTGGKSLGAENSGLAGQDNNDEEIPNKVGKLDKKFGKDDTVVDGEFDFGN